MATKYSLILLDLDGTVLDTLSDLRDALNFALRQNGFPERTTDEVRRFVGNGIPNLIERAAPPSAADAARKAVYAAFTERYRAHCRDLTRPYDGIPELLNTLTQRGCTLAVISNKDDYAVKELCAHYFPGQIAVALGRTDTMPKKPAPDMVRTVLAQTHTARENALLIGDSDVDVQTARNAGVDCVSVLWGFRDRAFLEQNGATRFASSPRELLRWIFE